jgi:antitoxin (DNA-binding transcriptional repressor) of toxin-antitoxin stability system
MAKSITATDAVRRFSDLLNTIKFKGVRYTIVRGGKPVATLGPATTSAHSTTLRELREILIKLPRLGDETAAFEQDLKDIAKTQPILPQGRPWA